MLCMLIPRVERLCRVADVEGGSSPATPRGNQASVESEDKAVNIADTAV